ncbi:MAG: baseplate J/gp47 family protein [Chloroflexi bacterium]|nr:baseplate J/gp47 family protein [Chloroflexota bacterium]
MASSSAPALDVADNESIASILFKLESLPGEHVVIVTRPTLRVFRNPVAMRLLQRKAEDLGITVSFVKPDEMTRNLCAETGFAVYGSLDELKRDTIRRDYHGLPEPAVKRLGGSWLSLAAGACVLALAVLTGYYVLPAASITLEAAAKPFDIDVPVTVDESANSVDLGSGTIPGRLVSTEVDGTITVQATGQRDTPDKPATGLVTFTNHTDQPVQVPASTVLLAGSVAFFTTGPITVSPSVDGFPGTGSATVQASQPGTAGNAPAGSITAIEGPLAGELSVLNSASTLGGTQKKTSFLSADDQSKAKDALRRQLFDQGLATLRSQLDPGASLLANPSDQTDAAVEQLNYTDSPEQVTTQTQLHIRLLVKGLSFDGANVNQVVADQASQAAAKLGPQARFQDATPLTVQPPVILSNDGPTARLQVHASASVVVPPNTATIADRVRGLDAQQAATALESVPGVAAANVQLWPAWARHVPSFSWRIHVALGGPVG